MSRFRLTIEYQGSRYHGWQQNSGVKTIQGEIIRVCSELLNSQRIELYGAGRTDAGVHALGQVAHLEAPTQMHPEMLLERLNEKLPFDIHVISLERCEDRFHARHQAIARSYIYMISRRRSAFGKNSVWWVKEDISVAKMKEAAALMMGFHDFSSFGMTGDEAHSTKVDIRHIGILDQNNLIMVHIIGSHFLRSMVRRMVGIMVHYGKGKMSLKEINQFLQRYSERPSQLAAPPSGLYLQAVYYPGDAFDLLPLAPVVF
jgi:tRNA pseudouridine38-40 synthase